jgi:uncharacterized protein (DUF1800 family)
MLLALFVDMGKATLPDVLRRLAEGSPMTPLAVSRLLVVAATCLCWLPTLAIAGPVFKSSFEAPFAYPATDAEAARFLNQATFGATPASIGNLRAQGTFSWISSQATLPPTLARPFLEALAVNENAANISLSQTHRVQRWIDTAVGAPDQLRQRVAWALGQIIVVSDQGDGLDGEPVMMAEWNDLLVRNALGNFRTLLGQVVRSPMMGRYLTHLRNRKFELTPRCWDQRPNSAGALDHNLGGNPPYHSCTSSDATNNGTLPPVIAMYLLPSSGLVTADENFARELMQLFTIGLIEREADFTPIIDPVTGQPVPTYDQQMITTLSRVMTGLGYACSGSRTVAGQSISRSCGCSGTDCSFQTSNFFSTPPSLSLNGRSGLVHPDRYEPMICYPRYHDTGRDRTGFQLPGAAGTSPVGASIALAAGQSLPGGTPEAAKPLRIAGATMLQIDEVAPGLAPPDAVNCDGLSTASPAGLKSACLTYCNDSLEAAIDLLFLEPGTATMIARQLIQRLVGSNPSPAYIGRVAAVFSDNGNGVRGDLLAVVRAVLTDTEARQPIAAGEVDAGKPREPLLKLVQLWRSFGAVSGDTRTDGYRRWARYSSGCSSGSWPQCGYQQRPLGAPSVFNFYEPDYAPLGEIGDRELVAPEFQIINESSALLAANDLYVQLCSGRGSSNNCHAPLGTPPTDRAYFPDAALDGLPGGNCGTGCSGADDAALINAINVRLFGGSMSGAIGDPSNPGSAANTGMQGTLLRFLQLGITGTLGEAVAQNARRREILYLLHLVVISPEFATQR